MARTITGVDHRLLRELQGELGGMRQTALERRRSRREPALTGDDARQHGRHLVQQVVTAYEGRRAEEGEPALVWEARQDLVDSLEAHIFGAGTLDQLLQDPDVEDIDINGHDHVFVTYADGTRVLHPPVAVSDEALIETIQTLAAHEGLGSRPFDAANPAVTLRLHDGSRLHAVQSVTPFPAVSIRKHRLQTPTLDDLVGYGTLDEELADFLAVLVAARCNVMIAGATSAGKTTLLRALARQIPAEERLITVERSLELGLHDDIDAHPNVVPFEERLANAEGVGGYTMAQQVRDSLRMNPSRVIVGEVLGDEVVTMLNAMNQGNDGSLSTIHANSSDQVPQKIATYAIQAPERLPWAATSMLIGGALDFVVFVRRVYVDGRSQRRVVSSVREIQAASRDAAGGLLTSEIFAPGPDGRAVSTGADPVCIDRLHDAGWRASTTAAGWT